MPDPIPTPAPQGATPAPVADPVLPVTPPAAGDPTPAGPASTPPVAPVVTGTVLDEVVDPKTWGEDWRQQYAGADEKLLKRLERYETPKAALDALLEAQKKISAGDFAKPLAADATPEQIAAWREANGVPVDPKGYFENLPDGVVLADEDKTLFEDVATRLHGKNVPPAVMHELVGWYNEFRDDQIAAMAEAENTSRTTTLEALKGEWGPEFKSGINVLKAYIATLPKEVGEQIISARVGDRPLLNDPKLANWLAGLARAANPAGTITPQGPDSSTGIEGRIKEIEGLMRTNRKAYNADEKVQAEYRGLLDARQKLAKVG